MDKKENLETWIVLTYLLKPKSTTYLAAIKMLETIWPIQKKNATMFEGLRRARPIFVD